MAEIPKEMLRAQTNVILLNVLKQGDNYATLYTIFKRLEKDGIISSYWGDESQGGRRKYYRLTEIGHENMRLAFESWSRVDEIIENLEANKKDESNK